MAPSFGLDSTFAGIDEAKAVWNSRQGNFLTTSIVELTPTGSDQIVVGGVRPQTSSISDATRGATSQFQLSGWEPADPRFVWVLGSRSAGEFPLPFGDGRNLGLVPDDLFLLTLNDPSTLLTSLDVTGTTASFPLGVPAGMTFSQIAVSFDLGPVRLRDVTDVIPVTVQ